MRELVEWLITTGQWQVGDPDVLAIADTGHDAPRLAHLLRDLPVQVLARMRSDRVLRRPAPPRQPHTMGRPPRHGGEFVLGQPDTWGTLDTETVTDMRRYGTVTARSWNRLHPKLTHRSSWATVDGSLPVVEGTVIRLDIDRLPSGATRSRSVCGGRARTPPKRTAIDSGMHTCVVSTSSTPSACSRSHSADVADGPHPRGGGPLDLADPR
jgi:hypothetical protein